MNRVLAAGIALTILGFVGYGAALSVAYTGRELSVTAIVFGITLVAIRDVDAKEGLQ